MLIRSAVQFPGFLRAWFVTEQAAYHMRDSPAAGCLAQFAAFIRLVMVVVGTAFGPVLEMFRSLVGSTLC